MIPVRDLRVTHTAFQVATHQAWFVEHLEVWRATELAALPYKKDDFAVCQGRVQVLDEVLKMFNNAEVDLARQKT